MPVDKNVFMNKLLARFFAGYEDFLLSGFSSIKEYYMSESFIKNGEFVNVSVFNKLKSGIFSGFDNNGNLLLTTSDDVIEKLNMGEII